MTAITDEAVAAKAKELHDEACVADCPLGGPTSTWFLTYARAVLEHEARRAAQEADRERILAELRDRLNRCDDAHIEAALLWIRDANPDLVNRALDEIEAPA